MILVEKRFSIALYSASYRPISFNLVLGMMKETTKLNILMSVWLTLTFIEGLSRVGNQNFGVHILMNLD